MSGSFTQTRLTIACFSIPEGYEPATVDEAVQQLRAAGVAVYAVELAGAGEPLLDIGEVTYIGESGIQEAVKVFTGKEGFVPSARSDDIDALAKSIAKTISEQLEAAGSYNNEVSVSVPQLAGIDPRSLRTRVWPEFKYNIQYATMDGGRSHLKYMHLKHFKLEVQDGKYTGIATGRLIDDTWSL